MCNYLNWDVNVDYQGFLKTFCNKKLSRSVKYCADFVMVHFSLFAITMQFGETTALQFLTKTVPENLADGSAINRQCSVPLCSAKMKYK